MTDPRLLESLLIVLAAAIVLVPLFQRLKISPIIGYLAAGLAIGPHGFGLIGDVRAVEALAEFGIVFLLFAVGLELPLSRLVALRRYMFGLGVAQVVLTALIIAVAAALAGIPASGALVIGGALALSSTATVMQLLADRNEMAARFARVAVAVLLLQDLAVVPLFVLLPLLSDDHGGIAGALALAGVKAGLMMAVIISVGRLVMRPIFRAVAATRKPEVFVAASLFVVLGTGWATAQVGMSMALGAFLAGMLLAETEYRHQVEGDLQPFRALFLGLFFVAVGMGIDLGLLRANAGLAFGLTAALLCGKALLAALLCRLFRLDWAVSLRVGLLLAQGGEFAFILAGLATQQGLIGGELPQLLVAVVAIGIAATPALAALGRLLARHLSAGHMVEASKLVEQSKDLVDHVVLAGFGRVGQTVARLLAAQGIPFVALDLDVHRVLEQRGGGLPVFYGDASRFELLRALGVGRARAVVITLDEPGAAERAVTGLRQHYPTLAIVARARDAAHGAKLLQLGATMVLAETVESSLQLGASALRLAGASPQVIEAVLAEFRRDDYARLGGVTPEKP